jgi:hypothetical protein
VATRRAEPVASSKDGRGRSASALRAPAARLPGPASGPGAAGAVLSLQRALGNRAVGRLLANAAGTPWQRVQRLIADPMGPGRLFVPPSWLDTPLDDRQETVREAAHDGVLGPQLKANAQAAIGVHIQHIDEVAVAKGAREAIAAKRVQDGLATTGRAALQPKNRRWNQLRQPLSEAVQEHNRVTMLPETMDVYMQGLTDRRAIIRPQEIVASASTLPTTFPMKEACALIAVVKSYGTDRSALDQKLGVQNLDNDTEYYKAMHRHYFIQQHIDYAEPSTHPALFGAWGFRLVFSGMCTFRELPRQLTQTLRAGSQYIFDIVGHSVLVKLTRDVTPGMTFEKPGDVFQFFSDSRNFDKGETNFQVKYIYERA